MRTVRSLAAIMVLLLGCGAPSAPLAPPRAPPPPDPAAEQRARLAAGARLIAEAKPTLDVRVLSDDEVFAELGGRTARHVLAEHVVLRAEVVARGLEVGGVSLVLEGEDGKVPIMARGAEGFAVLLTGEHYPAPHEWTEWRMMDVHYPKVEGLFSFMLAGAEVLIVGPLQLMSLHREQLATPPTDAEVRAAVPFAGKLLDKAAPTRSEDRAVQLVFAAKPAHPDAPLRVRAAVELRHAGRTIGVRAEAKLSPAPALEGRAAHVDFAPGEIALHAFPSPVDATCPQAGERRFDQPDGACPIVALAPPRVVTLGLEVPAPPAALGTAAASRAAKPSWASAADPPTTSSVGVAEAAADEDAQLVVCTTRIPKDFYAVTKLGGRRTEWWSSTASFPLVRVQPRGAFSVAIFEHYLLFSDDLRLTAKFKRSGAKLERTVTTKRSDLDVSCVVHGRRGIEEGLLRRWLTAMDELEALDQKLRIDLGKPRFGLEQRKAALEAIEGAAALVGWDDPRVRALVARVAAHEQHFGAALKPAFEAINAKLPRDPDYEVARTRCGKDAVPGGADFRHTSCVIDVKITDARAFYAVDTTTQVVLDDGTVVEGRIARDQSSAADTIRPAAVPAEHANARPWAIVRRTAKSIVVVRVSP